MIAWPVSLHPREPTSSKFCSRCALVSDRYNLQRFPLNVLIEIKQLQSERNKYANFLFILCIVFRASSGRIAVNLPEMWGQLTRIYDEAGAINMI